MFLVAELVAARTQLELVELLKRWQVDVDDWLIHLEPHAVTAAEGPLTAGFGFAQLLALAQQLSASVLAAEKRAPDWRDCVAELLDTMRGLGIFRLS